MPRPARATTPRTHPTGRLTISDDQFESWFRPIVQHTPPEEYAWGGCLLEDHGADLARVRTADPATVWTVVEDARIVSGYRDMRCDGYLVCEVPVPAGMSYTVRSDIRRCPSCDHILSMGYMRLGRDHASDCPFWRATEGPRMTMADAKRLLAGPTDPTTPGATR